MASEPMTCDEARARFSALVDDELTAAERQRVEAHLSGCWVCLPEWESFERTVTLFRNAPPSSAPPGFVERVLARVRPRTRWWAMGAGPRVAGLRALPVAALVLIAVAAVYIFERTPELRQAARPARVEPPPAPSAPPPQPAPPPPAIGRSLMKAEPPPPEKLEAAGPARPAASSAVPAASPPAPAARETPPAPRPRDVGAGAKPPPPTPGVPASERAKKSADVAAPPRSDEARLEAASRPTEGRGSRAAEAEVPLRRLATAAQARVFGTLRVDDHRTGRAAVLALVTRLGGGEAGPRADGSGEVIELVVPGDRYRELVEELGRLGTWVATPAPVRGVTGVSLSLRLDG